MYIILEMQTNGDTTALTQPLSYKDPNKADSAYYQKLAAAAISSVPVHTITMLDEHGRLIRSDYYEHIPAEPESNT